MSARQAAGNAGGRRACAAPPQAAALMASRDLQPSAPTWASSGQAPACKPNQLPPAPRQSFEATAPAGGSSRARRAEAVPNEAAPSGRSTDAGTAPVLFPISGGLTMERTAQEFFYAPLKSVPLGEFQQIPGINSKTACKSLIPRNYTLCEFAIGPASAFLVGSPCN
jgi:hypothetical protein